MKHVDIYTDGACRGNPGEGAWAAILVYNGVEKRISGYSENTTNNKMEVTAVIEALSCMKQNCDITVYTDSKYIVDTFQKGWMSSWIAKGWKTASGKPVKNVKLWKQLNSLMQSHEVRFEWVKGHNGHPYNEECDRMANAELDCAF